MPRRCRSIVLAPCVLLLGCASADGARVDELSARLGAVENKLERALQDAATARVDAATALHLLTSEQ